MDSVTFVAKYREHLPQVARFLARRVELSAVEDLCSDVFEIAWRKRDQAPEGFELPWLYKIAGNLVANQKRREQTARNWLSRFAVVSYAPSAEQLAISDLSLAEAWGKLRPIDREVLALTVLDGLSVTEASRILGISTNATSVRLNRARKSLSDLLKVAE